MLFWTVTLLLIAAAVAAVAMIVFNQRNGGGGFGASFFAPKAEKRLAVMEHASVDNRRKLILVRRDNVEHLIMTGGPVDVVIETGIGAGRPRASVSELAESTPVFTRQPRTFGQAVNE
jgi:flagellar protein FliO/FliZ